nr:MAG TPA: hypothetical protein [Caudoviricetes sp.]
MVDSSYLLSLPQAQVTTRRGLERLFRSRLILGAFIVMAPCVDFCCKLIIHQGAFRVNKVERLKNDR